MIINKNSSNTIVLTLTEKQTTTSHNWLFEFTNEMTGEVKLCYSTDISAYTSRYNEFVLIDSSTEAPLTGQLNFTPTGTWSYSVYEMTPVTPKVLSTIGYLAICQTGVCKVYDSTENPIVVFDTDETKSNNVFNDED